MHKKIQKAGLQVYLRVQLFVSFVAFVECHDRDGAQRNRGALIRKKISYIITNDYENITFEKKILSLTESSENCQKKVV